MTTTDEKAQQLEKLIAKIETRFRGVFITEEQWKFVLNRLTDLEKHVINGPPRRKGSLLDQVVELLDQNPKGLTAREIAEIFGRHPNAIRSIMYVLVNSAQVIAFSIYKETKTREKRYILRKYYGANRE